MDDLDRRLEALSDSENSETCEIAAETSDLLSAPHHDDEDAAAPQAELPPPPQASAPRPSREEPLELQLGRVWLVRLGIVIFLTGLVFLGNFAWNEYIVHLGAGGKLGLLGLAGGALIGIGQFLRTHNPALAAYGKILMGGGIAALYYTAYAAHFVEPLRVISSPLVGGLLLLVLGGGIVALAERLRSPGVAAAAIVLSFYTAAINPLTAFSLFSNLVLSVLAIILLVRRRWISVSLVSLAGCYLAYAFWRFRTTGTLLLVPAEDEREFLTAFLFPACYWLVFSVAAFLGRPFPARLRTSFLTVNNGAFFALTAPLVAGTYPEQFWIFSLLFGGVLVILGGLAARREPAEKSFEGAYLVQGLALLFLASVLKVSGYQLALLLALQSAGMMKLSTLRQGVICQVFSALCALAAAGVALGNLLSHQPHASLTAGVVAVLLTASAWLFKFQRQFLRPVSWQWRAAGFVALAFLLAVNAVFQATDGLVTFYALSLLALIATGSIVLLRLPEWVVAGQVTAWLGLLVWFWRPAPDLGEIIPFGTAALTLAILLEWWKKQAFAKNQPLLAVIWQSLHTLMLVTVIVAWSSNRFANLHPLCLVTSAALLLAWALTNRIVPLLVAAPLLSLAALPSYLSGLGDHVSWGLSLAVLLLLTVQSFLIRAGVNRLPAQAGQAVHGYAVALRGASVFLSVWFLQTYVSSPWQFCAFALFALALFLMSGRGLKPEFLLYATATGLVAVGKFFTISLFDHPLSAADVLGLCIPVIAQRLLRKRLALTPGPGAVAQHLLILVAVAGWWVLAGRMAAEVAGGFLLTISWTLVAFLTLSAGFLWRERLYRLLGLGIFAAAIGRIFLVDVWQLDTVYRILSFLTLGIVLLLVSFLYNRFAEALRRWI